MIIILRPENKHDHITKEDDGPDQTPENAQTIFLNLVTAKKDKNKRDYQHYRPKQQANKYFFIHIK